MFLAINTCLGKNQGNFNTLVTTSGKKQQAEEEEALRKRPQSVDQSNVQSKKVSVIREKFESPSPSASPTRFGPHSFVLFFSCSTDCGCDCLDPNLSDSNN